MKIIYLILLLLSIYTSSFNSLLNCQEVSGAKYIQIGSPILPIQSSNWAATDGLGRTLPMANQTGPYRQGKYVGIFYFLWHGEHYSANIYDITKLLKANPDKPAFGPPSAFHWWGEPEAGYYRADDPWVIRRNLQMLTMAGVDVLFFDVTNASTYLPTVVKLCEISLAMRSQGIPTPYISFVTYTKRTEIVTELYKQIYSLGRFSALWFRWQGKPLMLGKEDEMADPTIKNFFIWRFSWAWSNARNEPHHWQWLDNTPQNYGWDKDPNVPEEIPVAAAGHPNSNIGKSFHGSHQPTLLKGSVTDNTNQGLYFEEQWRRALEVDPQLVFVTGWNEWIAQRFVAGSPNEARFLGKDVTVGQTYFVDLYNREYNRDIEPMKEGYTDDYYYQLVANVRRFKGMDAPERTSPPQTPVVDGKSNEWSAIKPVFIDSRGDVFHRNYVNFDEKSRYINNTGRNDITESRVAYDAKNIYFLAKTNQTLTSSSGKNWMLLYIDSDQSHKTGWQGYDYLINQSIKGKQTSLSRWNGQTFQPVATGQLMYKANTLEIALPLNKLGLKANNINIDFHWADNSQQLTDITDFFINGDSAPDRRFNYRYTSK